MSLVLEEYTISVSDFLTTDVTGHGLFSREKESDKLK
jgi:hypothetical protein